MRAHVMPSEIDISVHKRRNNDSGNTARIQTWILSRIKIKFRIVYENKCSAMYHQY